MFPAIFFLLTFKVKVKVKGQRSRLRLNGVTYNINNTKIMFLMGTKLV